ncbi:MAG: DUF1761 domain-containing protein [Gammaproteobacteria bacterium]|nr:DUF1761 domain-containing protein [Gammaproteobacteria bacterium]
MIDFSGLNWIAILVSTGAAFALGGIWYGPAFGSAWMAELGKTEEELQPSPRPFIISFFSALLTCVLLAAIIKGFALTTLVDGIIIGFICGIGFIAASMASDAAFCGWGIRLFLIQAGYRVVYTVIMGMILAVWQ